MSRVVSDFTVWLRDNEACRLLRRLVLRAGDESRLTALVRSSTVEAGLAQRARIVLLAAEGLPNAEIARRVGVSPADGGRSGGTGMRPGGIGGAGVIWTGRVGRR